MQGSLVKGGKWGRVADLGWHQHHHAGMGALTLAITLVVLCVGMPAKCLSETNSVSHSMSH